MARLRLEYGGLDAGELSDALSAAILDAGLEGDVQQTLSKSQAGGGEQPSEPEIRALLLQWQQRHNDLRAKIIAALDYWTYQKQNRPNPFRLWPGRKRLDPNNPGEGDVYEAAALIAEMYRMAALAPSGSDTPFEWAVAYRDAWTKMGLSFADSSIDDYPVLAILAEYAYAHGRGQDVLAALTAQGRDRVGRYAAAWATVHAGSFITGIGLDIAGQARQRGVAFIAPAYRDTIAAHLAGKLRDKDGLLINPVDWRGLADVLREVMTGDEAQRDMNRVAATEVRWAFNVGRAQALFEEGVKYVQYRVQDTACHTCKRVYLHEDGTPKVFKLEKIIEDIALHGGLNAGRKASEYKPSAILHPYCHCAIVQADQRTTGR